MLDVQSTTDQKIRIVLAPKTAGGKPAVVDGIPAWEIDTSGGASLDVAPDGLSAFLISADNIGSAVWKVTADARIGPEVSTIEEGGTYTYTDAEASSLGVTAEPPVPKV